jgi:transcriptional regulator CtsR
MRRASICHKLPVLPNLPTFNSNRGRGRFERVLKCRKLVPLEALRPIAKRVLETVSKSSNEEGLMILLDRSMINSRVEFVVD